MVESLRLRVVFWAGERVRNREVEDLDVLACLRVRALGVLGMGARTAGRGGRGLLVVLDEVEGEGADLVTRPAAAAAAVDLVTLVTLVAVWLGTSGSGMAGDVVRPLSRADLVTMRETKVSSCSSMESEAVWVSGELLSTTST